MEDIDLGIFDFMINWLSQQIEGISNLSSQKNLMLNYEWTTY